MRDSNSLASEPKERNVRYWHLADIGLCAAMSALGGKADFGATRQRLANAIKAAFA